MVVPYRRGRHLRRHGPHHRGADERTARPADRGREHHRRRRHHRRQPRRQRCARRLHDPARLDRHARLQPDRSTRSAATTPSTTSRRSRCSPSSRWCSKRARTFPPTPSRSSPRSLKANGAKMQFGSAGAGSTTHLACSLLNSTIGVNVTHVPYRGSAPASNDLIGGQIDYLCGNLGAAAPLITGKQVKAIAVLSKSRSPLMPDLASAHEQGLTGMDVTTWTAIFLPKGAPRPIVDKLNEVTQATMETPLIKKRMLEIGVTGVAPERRIAGVSRQVRRRRGRALGRPDQVGRAAGRLRIRSMRCDSHVHIVGSGAKNIRRCPERTYLAGAAPVETLKRLGATRGITRFVIVQPSFYGADNSATLDALDALGGEGRGVAVIDPADIAGHARRRFTGAACAACASISTARSRRRAATRSKPRSPRPPKSRGAMGWHVQVIAPLPVLLANAAVLAKAPVPVVIDHYGLYGDTRPGSADGRRLLDLVSLPHVWIKLSAPYRHDRGPLNTRPDREWLAALIAAAPDRWVWGSDWPHPPAHEQQKGAAFQAPYRALSYETLVDEFLAALPVRRSCRTDHGRQRRAALRLLALDSRNRAPDNRHGRKQENAFPLPPHARGASRVRCRGPGPRPDLPEPHHPHRRRLCAGRHRRHRRAPDCGPARGGARPEHRDREPRRRDRRHRHAGGGVGAARRPHAADGPDRRDRHQPALDQGSHLQRREGPRAGCACLGGAARAGRPGQGALFEHGGTGQSADREKAAHLRLGRHRHAGPFRRGVPQAPHQGQSHPRALQGRGSRAQRSARRPRRYVLPGVSRGDAAAEGRSGENPRGVVGASAPAVRRRCRRSPRRSTIRTSI